MKIQILFGLIFIAQFCVDASHIVLTTSMVYSGEVENVRSSLSEYLEPQQLEKFLTIVSKFRTDAPKGEFKAGMKDLFVLMFTSKSTTSESDWTKIVSIDTSVLTADEIEAVGTYVKENVNVQFPLYRIMAQLRMNTENSDRVIDVLNKLGGRTLAQINEGRRDLVILALAGVSNKTETDARGWIF